MSNPKGNPSWYHYSESDFQSLGFQRIGRLNATRILVALTLLAQEPSHPPLCTGAHYYLILNPTADTSYTLGSTL